MRILPLCRVLFISKFYGVKVTHKLWLSLCAAEVHVSAQWSITHPSREMSRAALSYGCLIEALLCACLGCGQKIVLRKLTSFS